MTNEKEYTDKCNMILNWADRKPKFNKDFIESVIAFMEESDYITDSQMNAIDNIIEKCRIKKC